MGRVRAGKGSPCCDVGVWISTTIPDTSLGLGSSHLQGESLVSVNPEPLQLPWLLQAAGMRPRGTRWCVLPPRKPCPSPHPPWRETRSGNLCPPMEGGNPESSTSYTSSGVSGSRVEVMDLRWERRVLIRWGLHFSSLPGGAGGRGQMTLTLGQQKEAGHSPRLVGPFAGDMGPPKQGGTRYGSISSPPSPGPQQAPPGGTYLSEKIPIPDTESVRTLETSWGLSGCTGLCGLSAAWGGRSPEDQGQSLLALSRSDRQWELSPSCFCPPVLSWGA